MNKAKAIVLMHPTSPLNWRAVSPTRPRPMMEFYFESARACMDMFKATLVERYPNIRLLIPHCGGALPIALDRVMMLAGNGLSAAPLSTPAQVRKLWFDSAGSPFPVQMPALLRHTTADRIVYGSDFCFTPSLGVLAQMSSIGSAEPSPLGSSWSDTMKVNGSKLLNERRATLASAGAWPRSRGGRVRSVRRAADPRQRGTRRDQAGVRALGRRGFSAPGRRTRRRRERGDPHEWKRLGRARCRASE